MTFIVNQDGIVFQKDLGANTATTAAAIKLFDPEPEMTASTSMPNCSAGVLAVTIRKSRRDDRAGIREGEE
jgi:hypothetical protein